MSQSSSFVVRQSGTRLGRTWLTMALAAAFTLLLAGIAHAATITGTAYHDYNQNGVRDTSNSVPSNGSGTTNAAVDNGVGGVTVNAYGANGSQVATTTTADDGSYTLNPPGNGPFRIEFDPLPAGFEPSAAGPEHDTTVQYVTGDAAGIDVGVLRPCDYCDDNPTLFGVQAFFGDPQGANADEVAVFDLPYSAGAPDDTPAQAFPTSPHDQPTTSTLEVPFGDVGAVWGLAADRDEDRLFASAFMRKHSGFGPGGPGSIYQIDTQTGGVTTFATLGAGADPHDTTDYITDNFNTAWDTVGKLSLGGVDLSEDGEFLYAMNLADRSVYSLDADTGATVATKQVELAPPGCPAAGDVRPFALNAHTDADGVERLYIGMVCSAESTQDPADLAAYVYSLEMDPSGGLGSAWTLRLQAPLDYARELSNGVLSTDWEAWSPVYVTNQTGNPNFISYAQPWLTDIEFDGDDIILGLRDRYGDQTGVNASSDPSNPALPLDGLAFGDLLRACDDGADTFTLEDNGACGGTTGANPGNGFGPGGGEYYDDWTTVNHPETTFGSLAQAPGFPEHVGAMVNPIQGTLFSGGYGWYENATGEQAKAYRRYTAESGVNFAKDNGLGDTELLCERPPVEIGNYVWLDRDRDGVQDPDEPALDGITVELVENGTAIATTVTDAEGQYLFTAADGIVPGGNYTVRIPLDQPGLDELLPTTPGADDAIRDSDGIRGGGFSQVDVTVGGPGENDHTSDFGFRRGQPKLKIRKVATDHKVRSGDRVRWRIEVRNTGTATARDVEVCDRLPDALIFLDASGNWRADGGRICWRVTLSPGERHTYNVLTRVVRVGGTPHAKKCAGSSRGKIANSARVRGDRDAACVRVVDPPPVPSGGGVTGKR